MLKLLDKQSKFVIVKMDIQTYKNLSSKNPDLNELVNEAKNSSISYKTTSELMRDLTA
jgi:hypothetical protein